MTTKEPIDELTDERPCRCSSCNTPTSGENGDVLGPYDPENDGPDPLCDDCHRQIEDGVDWDQYEYERSRHDALDEMRGRLYEARSEISRLKSDVYDRISKR
jgi:hypothetical protein|tara:strand:+ start:735 stop:1040 length:306 start_codon:yes stop_codon:yes gene_type:complete